MRSDGGARSPSRPLETAFSLALLVLSLAFNYWLGRVSQRQGLEAHPSPDLLFRFLPLVDMRFFFVWGFAAFLVLALGAGFLRERSRVAYIAWSYALLITVRSVFIVLTPMRLPYEALPIEGYPVFDAIGRFMTFEHDLFFSGHTAFPYLGYLVFRDRPVRWAFLGLSLLMAATVILSRLHYSIDVFGAYFITYGLHRWEVRNFQPWYAAWRRAWGGGARAARPAPALETA